VLPAIQANRKTQTTTQSILSSLTQTEYLLVQVNDLVRPALKT
jgi:hypothetical protein